MKPFPDILVENFNFDAALFFKKINLFHENCLILNHKKSYRVTYQTQTFLEGGLIWKVYTEYCKVNIDYLEIVAAQYSPL